MKHTTSQVLYAYWDEVRAGRPAPRRFDIEPSRISHILAETLILERVDFETYRFRLAGTRICETFGTELRGCDFFSLWDEEGDRITIERHLSAITRQCKVSVLEFEATADDGYVAQFEMLLLPLIHTRGSVDRCLGAVSMAHARNWVANRHLSSPRLVSARLITTSGSDAEADSDRQMPLTPEIRAARIVRSERRQFRVYDGGLSEPRVASEPRSGEK